MVVRTILAHLMGLPYEEGQSIKRCEVLSELLLSVSVHIASIQCSAEILLKFSFGKGGYGKPFGNKVISCVVNFFVY